MLQQVAVAIDVARGACANDPKQLSIKAVLARQAEAPERFHIAIGTVTPATAVSEQKHVIGDASQEPATDMMVAGQSPGDKRKRYQLDATLLVLAADFNMSPSKLQEKPDQDALPPFGRH